MKLRILILALATFAVTTAGLAADSMQARGILVAASNEKRESDPRLAPYVPTLRRVLRFESYRQVGAGAGRATEGGTATVALGGGHRLEISVESLKGDQIRASVRWLDGGRPLMNTILVLKRGVPAVLGGPERNGEVLAVILIPS